MSDRLEIHHKGARPKDIDSTDFELTRLREENEKLRARSVLIPESVQKIIDDYPAVCAERDRMREALLFYKDANNWKMNSPLDMNSGNFTGGPAHDALEGVTEPASPWRDIESAPKDGTKFLLLYLGEPIIASWAHVISSETRELVGHNVKWFDGKETVQPLKDGLGRIQDCLFWMPLQEPPR